MADNPMYDETVPPHQQAMLDACHSGDLAQLQQLFVRHNVRRGDSPIEESWVLDLTTPSSTPKRYIREPGSQAGPPSTSKLFHAAASSKQSTIILFLLKTYPKFNFWDSGIMDAPLTDKDIETFRETYTDKRVHDFKDDDQIATALAAFLERSGISPMDIPLYHVQDIDNGGWLCHEEWEACDERENSKESKRQEELDTKVEINQRPDDESSFIDEKENHAKKWWHIRK